MRRAIAAAALLLLAAAPAAPIVVGRPNPDARLYGPADMLCDLHKCRLFNLPPEPGIEPSTIVEFGLPALTGPDRVATRPCFSQACRASVLGYPSAATSPPGHTGPTIFITPVELRLN